MSNCLSMKTELKCPALILIESTIYRYKNIYIYLKINIRSRDRNTVHLPEYENGTEMSRFDTDRKSNIYINIYMHD